MFIYFFFSRADAFRCEDDHAHCFHKFRLLEETRAHRGVRFKKRAVGGDHEDVHTRRSVSSFNKRRVSPTMRSTVNPWAKSFPAFARASAASRAESVLVIVRINSSSAS